MVILRPLGLNNYHFGILVSCTMMAENASNVLRLAVRCQGGQVMQRAEVYGDVNGSSWHGGFIYTMLVGGHMSMSTFPSVCLNSN